MMDSNLYESLNIAEKVRSVSKEKGIVLSEMLSALAIGSNTISNMRHGSMISAGSLARIADYLDVSVDYLLGRIDNEDSRDPHNIAKRIKSVAKYKGVSIGDLLESCGLGVNTISHLAKGQAISYVNLARIADYLDVSVDYLLGRTENKESHKG